MTKNKIDMEELKVKVVEVSQEKEQPQGNDFIRVIVEIDGRKIAVGLPKVTSMLYALILTERYKYIFCRFCRKLNIFFIFLHITN